MYAPLADKKLLLYLVECFDTKDTPHVFGPVEFVILRTMRENLPL